MTIRLRGLALCVLIGSLGWASPAAAQDDNWFKDFIGWLHEMSGPGPYNGNVITGEIASVGPTSQIGPSRSRDGVRFYLVLEAGWWNDKADDPDFPGNAYIHTYQLIAYFPIQKLRAVDLGAGFGFYRITGSDIQDPPLWRATIPLRVRLVPPEAFPGIRNASPRLRATLRSISYHIGFDVIPQGFSTTSFNGPPGFEPGERALWTHALVIDPIVLFDGLFRKR